MRLLRVLVPAMLGLAIAVPVGAEPTIKLAAAVVAPVADPDATHPLSAAQLDAADRRASAQARATGRAVEVNERASATRTWLAEPDGRMRVEESAAPSRVRRADGTWADIDERLRSLGGRLRPVAAATDVAFSANGQGPFASMVTDRGVMSLSWPQTLPVPSVAGDTATYHDVLPGVDLLVRATDTGFTHVLVVHDRAAAQNPALTTLRLGLSGLSGRVTVVGDLEFLGADGSVAATGGQAQMWDSTGGADATEPGERSRTAVATVAFEDRTMQLRPDSALLTGAGVTYPVYIDPSYSKADKRWAYANSANESNDGEVRVGKRSGTSTLYRSYFTYDFAPLDGKHIFNAELHTTIIHSWSCTSTPFSVFKSGTVGSGKLTWSAASLGAYLGSASGHAHKPSTGAGCSDDPQKDMNVEVGGTTTAYVASAAAANWQEIAFVLSAANSDKSAEGTENRWKKFRLANTKLVVDFNSYPAVPTSASTDGRGCATGDGRSAVSTATPTLRAVVNDPDIETDLQGVFEWQRYDSGSWTALGSGVQSTLRSAATAAVQVTNGLTQGPSYRWRVKTGDPWSYNGKAGTDFSNPSGWCEFTVDLTGPAVAPGVSSTVYGSDLSQVYGAVGRTAPFTFSASGVGDVTSYRYGWSDPPSAAVSVAAGASVTVILTPPPPAPADPTSGGLTRLYVVSLDAAGHISPENAYTFNLGNGTTETGRWNLDDAAFANSVAGGPAAVASGGPTTGVAGRLLPGPGKAAPTAVSFDGTNGTAVVNAAVVDTTTSFSISVWARSDAETGDYRSIVSGPGTHSSAFFLGRSSSGRWRFTMPQTDTVGPVYTNTFSTSTVQTGVWTNLVAVYDAGARMVYLYVNGVLEGSAPQAATFAATRLQIASDFWNDSPNLANKWKGAVADLRVWNRVLTAAEIAPQATDLVGRWNLDGDGTDSTPFTRTATPTSTALWAEGHDSEPFSALQGDGATVAATTAGPVVRSDQSYTVAAWARLDAKGAHGEILGQAGSAREGILLRYDYVTDEWQFFVPTVDVGTPSYYSARSNNVATIGVWTHLVGVYDASAGILKIYVNGVLNGSIAGHMWASSGVFDIGRERGGAYFNGAIDDVRMYAGAMPAAQVAALYAG